LEGGASSEDRNLSKAIRMTALPVPCGGGLGGNALRSARTGLWAVVLLSSVACTFEETGTPGSSGGLSPPEPGGLAGEEPQVVASEETALLTVRMFRESVASGDLTLALSLLDREATLIDAMAGEASEAETRGELLLELRGRHASGVVLEPLRSDIRIPVAGVALVTSRLAVLQEGPGGIGEDVGRVDETVLLVATPEGWRIRHLHRSLRSDG
jgi:hypothetical protein